jgi:hypothetical protein
LIDRPPPLFSHRRSLRRSLAALLVLPHTSGNFKVKDTLFTPLFSCFACVAPHLGQLQGQGHNFKVKDHQSKQSDHTFFINS